MAKFRDKSGDLFKEKEATKKRHCWLVQKKNPSKTSGNSLWNDHPSSNSSIWPEIDMINHLWWNEFDENLWILWDLLDRNVRIGSFGRKIPSSNPWATTQSGCPGEKTTGGCLESGIYRYIYIYRDTNLIYLFIWFWYFTCIYFMIIYMHVRIYTHKDWSFPYDIAWHTT